MSKKKRKTMSKTIKERGNKLILLIEMQVWQKTTFLQNKLETRNIFAGIIVTEIVWQKYPCVYPLATLR